MEVLKNKSQIFHKFNLIGTQVKIKRKKKKKIKKKKKNKKVKITKITITYTQIPIILIIITLIMIWKLKTKVFQMTKSRICMMKDKNRDQDSRDRIMDQEFIILLRCIPIQCRKTNQGSIRNLNIRNTLEDKEIQMENIWTNNFDENLQKCSLTKQEVSRRIQLQILSLDNQIK